MILHPPKNISSIDGLGVDTTKTMHRIDKKVSIGTEIWNEMNESWTEGSITIAKPGYVWVTKWEVGKPYIITKFYDQSHNLIGIYCDVSRPVQSVEGGFTFVDLYLDVWQVNGQDPVILDEDELEDAVSAGYISKDEAEKAGQVADKLIRSLKNDPKLLDF